MDDLIAMLAGSNIDPQVLAAALRKRQTLGLIGQMSGDRVLAPIGKGVALDAERQTGALQDEVRDAPGRRLRQALEQQALTKGQQQQADVANPATRRVLAATMAKLMPGIDLTDAPASVLQANLGTAEKAYSADQSAAARRDATAERTKRDAARSPTGDAEEIAQAIMEGRQPPDLKGMWRFSAPIRASLARSGYDLTAAQRDWQAVQRHTATLNGPQQERARQAVVNATGQLDNVEDLYGQWQKVGPASGFRVLNRAALAGAKQVGGEAGAVATNLEGQIELLASEVGNALMGGNSPTDHALKMAQKMLSGDWNEETFRKALTTLRKDLSIRNNSMMTSTPAGLSAGSRFAPQPGPGVQAPSGPKRIQNDAEYEALPSGTRFIDPEGTERTKP